MGIIADKSNNVLQPEDQKTEHMDHMPEHPVKDKRKVIKLCIRS